MMRIDLSNQNLTKFEKVSLEQLLLREDKSLSNDLEQMWYLMDLIWDDYGCDNRNLDWEKIGQFYSHPVWLLNGLFIEQHNVSMCHRRSISDWIIKNDFKDVVDYGGGFGTLARLIAENNADISVDIYEPYPSEFGIKRASEFQNINIIGTLDNGRYDCLINTEVLEHVPDPLSVFFEMIQSVKVDGYLIVSYDFNPVIKCHLPDLFHFRYDFFLFGRLMGVEFMGSVSGYSSAKIFKKKIEREPDWKVVRNFEKLSKIVFSKILFSFLEILRPVFRSIKRLIKKP